MHYQGTAYLCYHSRGCASQPKVLAMATDCSATCDDVSRDRCSPDKHYIGNV